ncbi:MAG: nuclear transport factor 2 family protein [Bacteroidales bacterium]
MNSRTEMSPELRQEIADKVRTNFMEMMKLAENNTIENINMTFKKYIDTSAVAWIKEPAMALNMITLYPDKESAFTAWAPKEDSRSGTAYKIEDEHIAVLTPESALYVFTGTFSIIDQDGNMSDEYPVSGTYVFVKTDDRWKILHFHQSWEN